ncbi:DUF6279 family lipoprotein [uncultured Oxalicibacterium sp.]|uniref:DUF6279 family lipoprotein n=1 Tax=uncultured Oxalicibacterium sp. TaxID=1168540 RepID=UPI0025E83208|nr:DUF6279 family lipoprotein [uncultured Oxalicibacterium sp.]
MQNTITRPITHERGFSWRLLILAACVVLLSACSAARLGFNNGATVTYWWLDSYIDFEGEQKPWVKRHIDDLFSWQRSTQLRGYVDLASRIQRRDLSAVTAEQLLADFEDGKKRVQTFSERAAPELADLALSLNAEQIANIEEKLDKNNAKFRKEYLSGSREQRQEFRFKKMMKQAEYWFGRFSREQEAELRLLSDARPLDNELVFEVREKRQEALIALLQKIHAEKPSKEETIRRINAYARATSEYFGVQRHRQFYEATTKANAALVAAMMRMATPQQQSHFVNVVQDWITDFNRLSAKAAS